MPCYETHSAIELALQKVSEHHHVMSARVSVSYKRLWRLDANLVAVRWRSSLVLSPGDTGQFHKHPQAPSYATVLQRFRDAACLNRAEKSQGPERRGHAPAQVVPCWFESRCLKGTRAVQDNSPVCMGHHDACYRRLLVQHGRKCET